MREFDDYFKENIICHKVIAFYLLKQNKKAKSVNRTIISLVRAIFAQQKLFLLL